MSSKPQSVMNDEKPSPRKRPKVCYFRHKVPYWTIEEAEDACVRYEEWQGDLMKTYTCCDHWHIAHRQRKLSMKNRHKYFYCRECKGFNKRVRAEAHQCYKGARNETNNDARAARLGQKHVG